MRLSKSKVEKFDMFYSKIEIEGLKIEIIFSSMILSYI